MAKPKPFILIVEDDKEYAGLISEHLENVDINDLAAK